MPLACGYSQLFRSKEYPNVFGCKPIGLYQNLNSAMSVVISESWHVAEDASLRSSLRDNASFGDDKGLTHCAVVVHSAAPALL